LSETDSEPERADEEGVSDPRRGAHLIARAGVVLLAFALRVLYVREVWPHPAIQLPVIDALAYRDRALEILAGDWLGGAVYYLDPLYPFFLAVIYLFVPPDSVGVLVAQAALDAASVGFVMTIAHRVRDEPTAIVAGLIAATYKPFFYYSALLLKAPLMIFLVVVALYLVIRAADDDDLWRWGPAGFLLGLAALTRGNSLLFAPVLGLWILVAWRGDVRRRILAIAVLGMGLACAIGPVTLRNWVVGDDLVVLNSQAGQNFYIGHFEGNETGAYVAPPFLRPNPEFEESDFAKEALERTGRDMKPSEISNYWLHEGLLEIADDPMRFVRHSVRKVLLLVNAVEIPDNVSYAYFAKEVSSMLSWPLPTFGLVVCLAAAGVVVSWRDRLMQLLMLYFLAYASGIILFFNLSRLRLPLVPVLILLAATVLVVAARRVRGQDWRAVALPAALALVMIPVTRLDLYSQSMNVRYVNMGVGFVQASDLSWQQAQILLESDRRVEAERLIMEAIEHRSAAQEQFEKALEVDPGYPRAILVLRQAMLVRALLHDQLGDYEQALELARETAGRFPGFVDAHVVLGQSLLRLDRLAGASQAFQRALSIEPGNREARAGLLRIQRGAAARPSQLRPDAQAP